MIIIDVTNAFTLLLLVAATILLIFLGKEIKKPIAPAIALIFFLILIVIHSVELGTLAEPNIEEYKPLLLKCLGVDAIMVFISFFGYLWIDDISAKHYKKKSISNTLDWFWGKV